MTEPHDVQAEQPRASAGSTAVVEVGRRAVLVGAAGVAGGLALASCSSDSGSGSGGNGSSDDAEEPLATVVEIPDGSAKVVSTPDGKVVLVRSGEGVTAVSAVCTHQGCTVQVIDGALPCPCHGSRFAFDGSVLQGPATKDLAQVAVTVTNGEVFLA